MPVVPAMGKEPSAALRGAFSWIRNAGDALTSVFLPADCRLCEQPLLRSSRLPVCEDCLAAFPRISSEKQCATCGLPLQATPGADGLDDADDDARHPDAPEQPVLSGPTGGTLCGECRSRTFRFDLARSFACYENPLVRAVLLLKFEELEPLADWFADRLAELVRQNPSISQADLVVPVPLHKQRRNERGFNQAELLSKRVARRLKLPHAGVLLVRKKPRPDKHLLTQRERWESVRGAFATHAGSQVDNRRVLLVDDVMTTGATLDACAKALRDAGASEVFGLTVARATGGPRKVSVRY